MVLQLLFLNIWKHLADVTDPSRAQAAGQALHSSRCSLQRETFESKKWAKGQEEIVSEEKSPCLRQGSPRSEGGCS